ncbi:putative DNA helicase ino80, variant 2 [Pyricularia grisea]|nr:putative DNA helicase ino80, variant 2 [Pyricularia grisea]
MEPSNFHSTVLARPPGMYDEDDDHRRRQRDILNPPAPSQTGPGSGGSSSAGGPRPPFSLRSPTQSEFHHQSSQHHYSASSTASVPQSNYNGTHNGVPQSHSHSRSNSHSRPSSSSVLHSPYQQASTASRPAHALDLHRSPQASGLQAPQRSPGLHAPSVYYSQDSREHHPPPPKAIDKPASSGRSFYDPLTDTTTTSTIDRERRTSDAGSSWHNATTTNAVSTPSHRDAYSSYSKPVANSTPYYGNGKYTSPTTSSYPPRSPASHPQSVTAATTESTSPSTRPPRMATPNILNPTTTSSMAAMSQTESPVQKAAVPAATPSRAAELMSFSNILSSSEPAPKPRPRSPVLAETPNKEPEPEPEQEPTKEASKEPSPQPADMDETSDSPACPEKPAEVDAETEPDAEMHDDVDTVDGLEESEKPEPPIKREKSAKVEKAPRRPRVVEKEKKERVTKAPRKSAGAKGRASEVKAESTPKQSRRSSGKQDGLGSSRVPAKRQANGLTKQKAQALEQEKAVIAEMEQLDEELLDEAEARAELRAFKKRKINRQKALEMTDLSVASELLPSLKDEAINRHHRRCEFSAEMVLKLGVHVALGRLRFGDQNYDAALKEVREQELFAEKERKKDMQRKRRREKSMAVTIEQKEAALAKAHATEDKLERQKLLREAERANKKAQQTKLILQKGIKGPARNITPMDMNLDGGTMATFSADSMEPGKGKGKGRAGNRPKKSKEQKQAEKEAAEAAQAALDAGQELPSKEENPKIRIKVNKGKLSKDKDRDVDVDTIDGDNAETKDPEEPPPKKKGKVVEEVKDSLETRFQSKGYNQIYDQIWRDMARKDVSKVYRLATDSYYTKASNLKKTAILAAKEAKRWQLRTNKGMKDLQARGKRVMRDMMTFWKRNEREERDLRKAAERQELENARKEEADREAARQKRKLNFLISQTELYSHFIGKKIKTDEVERSTDRPEVAAEEQKNKPAEEKALTVKEPTGPVGAKVTNFENLDFDAEDDETLQAAAMANAQNAIAEAQRKARNFNNDDEPDEDGEMNFQNPTGLGDVEIEQPKLLTATLKEYQLKGLNWLVNLYEQGINGILADEMGLGKTIQSISVMAYLAEHHDIWGPFLVVAPASTLHNWEQEIKRFVPDLKIVPYWGSAADRKILRKFWDRKHSTYKRDAQFHVAITSYQMVVSDVAYFQKMKWQYMILDEAQAIKSSQSSRWKCLLSFHCRNRLLLTGTPIQNNMQELWALLHFIMPSLFDSHEEFSDWFSKDIESHAQSNSKLNEDQLKRLHMILKPFMLRRVKKHVQKELGDKIELDVYCDLTYRQRAYYANLRNQISIMDLIEKATLGDDNDSGTLMNLVMQFRKVCNHPDLFERADTSSPLALARFAETGSFAREGNDVTVGYTTRSVVEYSLPRLIWRDGGRLTKAGSDNPSAGFRSRYLGELMNIWSSTNVRESLDGTDNFSFLRFADTSMSEAETAGKTDLFARASELAQRRNRLAHMHVAYDDEEEDKFTPAHALFLIRQRQDRSALSEITSEGALRNLMNVSHVMYDDANLPRMDQAARPGASAPPIEVVCHTSSAQIERERVLFNVPMRKALFGPNLDEQKEFVLQKVPVEQLPPAPLLPKPDNERQRFTSITVPSMRQFITNSGKLAKLDELLFKLKAGGHRVLLYFQMTRMIDLMEEYLTYRNWKYCRLDGSTKLEDRRDTVHDFQTNPSIFVFLLSTRAGGLGINLTSADTVIFYDSDWNPTIDSQAMDRAHRLGQTRQVTVYRLITRGTIEERIRKRAMQKEEVQRVVITGGAGASSGVDFSGRRAPENRNRDIAMWLADDDQAELIERRERELLESGELDKVAKKRGGGKRKKTAKDTSGDGGGVSLDEMYHEGEGNFDDNKLSGAATPNVPESTDAKPGKKKKATGKKAKTTKQRLAIADGQMDM